MHDRAVFLKKYAIKTSLRGAINKAVKEGLTASVMQTGFDIKANIGIWIIAAMKGKCN